jgi:hypothetical protein
MNMNDSQVDHLAWGQLMIFVDEYMTEAIIKWIKILLAATILSKIDRFHTALTVSEP